MSVSKQGMKKMIVNGDFDYTRHFGRSWLCDSVSERARPLTPLVDAALHVVGVYRFRDQKKMVLVRKTNHLTELLVLDLHVQ